MLNFEHHDINIWCLIHNDLHSSTYFVNKSLNLIRHRPETSDGIRKRYLVRYKPTISTTNHLKSQKDLILPVEPKSHLHPSWESSKDEAARYDDICTLPKHDSDSPMCRRRSGLSKNHNHEQRMSKENQIRKMSIRQLRAV